ncbi:MAG: OsmC family protein [Psychromonas sp.]
MKSKTTWVNNKCFISIADSKHSMITDAPESFGGNDSAQTPVEQVLAAAGSCAAMDVVTLMGKQKQPLTSLKVSIDAVRATEAPTVFTALHFIFELSGNNLKQKTIQRSLELTFSTYCCVSIMLERSGAKVTWEYKEV